MVCRPQAARPILVGLPAVGDYAALLGETPHLSTVRNIAGLWEPATKASSFREGLLDHELRGLAMIALDKAALREQHARVVDQRRAAADQTRSCAGSSGASPISANSFPDVIKSVMRPRLRKGSRVTV